MNSTPRRLRTSACAVLVGAALVTTACGTDAESRPTDPTPQTAASDPTTPSDPDAESTEVGSHEATTHLDPARKDEFDIPELVLDDESRDAAITAIGDVLYDDSSPGTAAAALQVLRVPDDFAVLRVYGNCSTDSGTLLRTGDRAHLIEQFEELQRVCVRESIIVEVWVVPRSDMTEAFSVGEAEVMLPGGPRVEDGKVITPVQFTAATYVTLSDTVEEPSFGLVQAPADVGDIVDRAKERNVAVPRNDYVGVVVEQARTPCASARLALLDGRLSVWSEPFEGCDGEPGSERAEFLVPRRLLGAEVVVGLGETPGDDDQLVELN